MRCMIRTLRPIMYFSRVLGGTQTKRLSMNFRSGYEMVNFQLGDTLLPRCGHVLGRRLMFGTVRWRLRKYEPNVVTQDTGLSDLRRSPMIAETPVFGLAISSEQSALTRLYPSYGHRPLFRRCFTMRRPRWRLIEVILDRIEGDDSIGATPH